MQVTFDVVARARPRVMAQIVTMLVHRGVRTEALSFRLWDAERMVIELAAAVRSAQEAELVELRLRRIVDVLSVESRIEITEQRAV